jgi:N4-gp56 family major capsid protein
MTTDSGTAGAVQISTAFSTTEIKTYYLLSLLERLLPSLYHCAMAQKASIPERAGGTVEWRKFAALSVATTALTPGVTPASEATSVSNITATPSWYGSYIRYSDEFKMTAIDDILDEYVEMLGEQAGDTSDQLARALMVASGTAQIVGQSARTSLTSSNVMTARQLVKAYATLLANNAKPMREFDDMFPVIMHPHVWYDLTSDPEFHNAYQQAQPRSPDHPLFTGKMYDYCQMRIFLSSNAYIETDGGDGTTDAYLTMVFGRNAFGIAGIGQTTFDSPAGAGGTDNAPMPVEMKFHNPEPSSSDPLGQRGSVGWIGTQEEVELNANCMIRIESASSIGSN